MTENDNSMVGASSIQIIEETAIVDKQRRITGRWRVRTVVHEDQQVIDEPLISTEAEIRRVPIERWVDAPVGDRMEGETLIVSLHREVVVVERRLQVFEEIHIVPRQRQRQHQQTVTLRREEAVVERIEEDAPAGSGRGAVTSQD